MSSERTTSEPVPLAEVTHAFVKPGDYGSIIDGVHPVTGRSCCFDQTLEQVRERYPEAIVMLLDDWRAEKIKLQETPIQWIPCSERRYREMLEVLPPIGWDWLGFLVGEPSDHSARTGKPRYQAFVVRGSESYKHYYASSRPLTVAEWRDVHKDPPK